MTLPSLTSETRQALGLLAFKDAGAGVELAIALQTNPQLAESVDAATRFQNDWDVLRGVALQALVAANNLGVEVDLMNNDLKTPYSDQFSLGVRNRFELWNNDWNTSATVS